MEKDIKALFRLSLIPEKIQPDSYLINLANNCKFPNVSDFLVTKSLTYFKDADADAEPTPEMLVPVSWERC